MKEQNGILGRTVVDLYTGACGICVGRTEYLFSSPRIQVQPECVDKGHPVEPFWVYEDQCEVLENENAKPRTVKIP